MQKRGKIFQIVLIFIFFDRSQKGEGVGAV